MCGGNRSGEIDSKCYQRFSLSEIIVDFCLVYLFSFSVFSSINLDYLWNFKNIIYVIKKQK